MIALALLDSISCAYDKRNNGFRSHEGSLFDHIVGIVSRVLKREKRKERKEERIGRESERERARRDSRAMAGDKVGCLGGFPG